jgi:SAM-dependent methyltransferase
MESEHALMPLRGLLVCPACREGLTWSDESPACPQCRLSFRVEDDIPVLLAGEAEESHKGRQALFFDEVEPEFEITRPYGTPRYYAWLIGHKFALSISALRPLLPRGTVLSVCGGSGMDAEFLARTGARVVLADISLGAVHRARERSRRFGFPLEVVVADVEQLPFADRSVDLVYVHDGLHHLESPTAGLAEMARVARRAVSVNEPSRATATRLAVRFGLSEVVEEAGNPVERLDPGAIVRELEACGFEIVALSRYAMVYRHEPGRASRLLSRPPLFQAVRAGMTMFNLVAGGIGNKLTVQAVRR